MIERFQGGSDQVRDKLNHVIDVVNNILLMRGDEQFIAVRRLPTGGLTVGLNIEQVKARIPKSVCEAFPVVVTSVGSGGGDPYAARIDSMGNAVSGTELSLHNYVTDAPPFDVSDLLLVWYEPWDSSVRYATRLGGTGSGFFAVLDGVASGGTAPPYAYSWHEVDEAGNTPSAGRDDSTDGYLYNMAEQAGCLDPDGSASDLIYPSIPSGVMVRVLGSCSFLSGGASSALSSFYFNITPQPSSGASNCVIP